MDIGFQIEIHAYCEESHNEPHVHVRDTGYEYEASLALKDGRILAGSFPRKLLKKAQRKLVEEQAYFLRCWNTQTDGLTVDINHHFGYIKY